MLVALTKESRYDEANRIIGEFTEYTRKKILILLNHFDKFFEFDPVLHWWKCQAFNGDPAVHLNDYKIFNSANPKSEWNCECMNFIYTFGRCSHIAVVKIYRLFMSDMQEIHNFVNYYTTKTIMKRRIKREMRRARKLQPKIVIS